jgi:predicted membrane channel-forming protein YqfA (hemolysin III family)
MRKNILESVDYTLCFALFATVSTAVAHAQIFQGHALAFWTAFMWTTALAASVLFTLMDEVDVPTTLARYIMFGVMIFAVKMTGMFGLDVVYPTAIVLTWRWIDVGLMWLNWHRCRY